MASLNKALIIGHLGADPEIRYMPDGTATCRLSIATTKKYKNRNGEQQEHTEWHRINLFRRLAEIAGEYLKKGSQVYIDGEIRTRKWTDSSNIERYSTEIQALNLQMLSPGNRAAGQGGSHQAMLPEDAQNGESDDDIPF